VTGLATGSGSGPLAHNLVPSFAVSQLASFLPYLTLIDEDHGLVGGWGRHVGIAVLAC
jgi:hypothetical protein